MKGTLQEFMATYASNGAEARIVANLDARRIGPDGLSPFIVVRDGYRVVLLNLMKLPDHLCIDVRAFIAGNAARTGVFGMEDGRRYPMEPTPGRSHGWAGCAGISLLIGEQT